MNALSGVRFAACGLVLGLAAASHASYELLAIPATDNTLRRIDPLSGAQLGSIALPAGTTALQLNRHTGHAYALAGAWIHRFDYSTGERAGAFNLTGITDISVSANGDTLYALAGANLRRYRTSDFALLAQNPFPAVFGTPRSISFMGGNLMAVSEEISSPAALFASYTMNLDTMTFVGLFGSASNGVAPLVPGKNAAVSLPDGGWRVVSPYRSSNGSLTVNTTRFGAAGNTLAGQWFNTASFGSNPSLGVAAVASHGGFYLIGPNGASGTRIEEYEASSLALLSVRTYAFNTPTGFFAPAAIVAPEPGTVLALGAGLAVLARRRRSRR